MSDKETKVLVEFSFEVKQALANLAISKTKIDELKVAQKSLDTTTAEGKKMYEAYGAEIRNLTKSAQAQQKQIDNTIKAERAEADSLDQLKARLSTLTAEYGAMSKAQKKSAEGKELQASIKGISDSLKEEEGGLGNNTRKVGEYEDSINSALGMNKGFIGSLMQMAQGAKATGSTFGKELVNGVKAGGKALLSLLANPIVLIIAAIAASVMLLFKAFKSTDDGATKLAGVFTGLKNVMDVLLDRVASYLKLLISIVTLDLNGMKKNAQDAFGGVGDAIADAAKAGYEYEQQMDRIKDLEAGNLVQNAELRKSIEELKNQSKDVTKTKEERLTASQRAMSLETALMKREKEISDARTDAELKNLASKINATNMTTKQKEAALTKWLAMDGKEIESAKAKGGLLSSFYDQNEDDIQKLQKMKADDILLEANFSKETRRLFSEDATLRKSIQAEATAKAKEAAAKRLEIATNLAKAENDLFNLQKTSQTDQLKEISANEKKTYQERLNAVIDYESQQIEVLKTNAAFEISSQKLTGKQKLVVEKQLAQEIIKLKSETEKQITDLDLKALDTKLKNAATNLEKQKQDLANAQQIDLINLSKSYANDIKKAKNAEERTALEKKYEKDKFDIAQKYREADFNSSVETMTAELRLANLTADQKIAIEKAIADAKAKYAAESASISIKANEEIVKSTDDSAKKQIEIENQLKEKKRELYTQLEITLQDITNGIFATKSQELDAETQKVNDENDKQLVLAGNNEKRKQAIAVDTAAKLADLDKEKRKQAREQAISERLFAAFSIALSTSRAIMASLSAPPVGLGPIAGIPLGIATGAIGALQLVSVMSQPLPKAERGRVFSGPSHSRGGIPVEVEGGEMILTKGVYRDPTLRHIASIVNQLGGGIPLNNSGNSSVFATGGVPFRFNDGGYAARSAQGYGGITKQDIEDAMTKAVAKVNVNLSFQDFKKEEANYIKMSDRADF